MAAASLYLFLLVCGVGFVAPASFTKRRPSEVAERSVCVDTDPACEEMATDGLCTDPDHQAFMEKACPYACDACSDRKRRRLRAIVHLKLKPREKEEDEEKRDCVDLSPKCQQYAVDGFCSDSETSALMAKSCPSSCDGCKREIETRSSCVDVDPNCEIFATEGFCTDPSRHAYLSRACPFACDVCTDRKRRRARSIAELKADAQNPDVEEAKRGCQDFSPKCEQYAVDGLCRDAETSNLMSRTCAFACDACKREEVSLVARAIEELTEVAARIQEMAKRSPGMAKRCQDFSPKCELYAGDGLCRQSETSGLMTKTCASACDICKRDILSRHARAIEDLKEVARNIPDMEKRCQDFSPKCEQYAVDGLCRDSETSNLMAKSCAFACDSCKREVSRHARAIEDLQEIAERISEEEKRCMDFSPKCEQYAVDGLCRDAETSNLMARTCAFACDGCKRELRARGACVDRSSKCEMWATDGMCRSDPDMAHFMSRTCPFACDVC